MSGTFRKFLTSVVTEGADVTEELKSLYVDQLHRCIRTGLNLQDAEIQLRTLLGIDQGDSKEPVFAEAVAALREKIDSIELLREPTTIRGQRRTNWYPGPGRSDVFWPPYARYLTEERGWPSDTVGSIDRTSSRIISLLDFPGEAEFSTRGLVLGYVQSGKTANFMGVVSKAADVGFRLIIVMSGLTNSLRQQTQERVDGDLISHTSNNWLTWTDSASDFGDMPFNANALLDGEKRNLAVVKKNAPRLKRLLGKLQEADPRILRACPVLIIDDECDQASVNATGVVDRVSVINGLIREMLALLPKSAYIGYTATPFANVLIDPSYPDDLYPRDFIVSLPRPDGYFGAEHLFGRDVLDAETVSPDEAGFDMIRTIPDDETARLQPAGRADRLTFVPEITPSFRDALLYFLLATAAREQRGQGGDHSSMLVHTTVYADCHINAKPVVEEFLGRIAGRLRDGDDALEEECSVLWEREQSRVPPEELGQQRVSFESILPLLGDLAERIQVVVENSLSDERLDFNEPGRRYVVIGGNVLARGLTIEGLVVSFFLRTASQYDSLMQMGRWFGYRHGYEDLPRVWTTVEMQSYFHDMATVEAEIRRDIEVYEKRELTPAEFAVRIRTHPDLAVTARGKMSAAVERNMSFDGLHRQTRKFHNRDLKWLARNWNAGSRLIDAATAAGELEERPRGNQLIRGVPVSCVLEFLDEYQVHDDHVEMQTERFKEYIDSQNTRADGALGHWNIAIISGKMNAALSESPLGSAGPVRTVVRSRLDSQLSEGTADIKALMGRSDITVDVDPQPDAVGRMSWDDLKELREPIPLLLLYPIDRRSEPLASFSRRASLDASADVLGLGVVFPEARVRTPISYVSAPIDESLNENLEFAEEELGEL